jgi:hypothetical protein
MCLHRSACNIIIRCHKKYCEFQMSLIYGWVGNFWPKWISFVFVTCRDYIKIDFLNKVKNCVNITAFFHLLLFLRKAVPVPLLKWNHKPLIFKAISQFPFIDCFMKTLFFWLLNKWCLSTIRFSCPVHWILWFRILKACTQSQWWKFTLVFMTASEMSITGKLKL